MTIYSPEEMDKYLYDKRYNYTHRGIAFRLLQVLLESKEDGKGIRLKHPIQIVADFIHKESVWEEDDTITELMMETGEKLIKYYSEKDSLCLAVAMANNDDTIDEKYIEVIKRN